MQTIAIACLAIATAKTAFLLWTLWRMSSTGRSPAWVAGITRS